MNRKQKRINAIREADNLYNAGKPLEATKILMGSIELFDQSERDNPEYARFCLSLGSALAESGNFSLAKKFFNQALRIFNSHDHTKNAAFIHYNLGNVYKYENVMQKAIDHYQKALDQFKNLDDKEGMIICHLALCQYFVGLGIRNEGWVKPHLTQLASLKEHIQANPATTWAYFILQSNLEILNGNFERALELAEVALQKAQCTGNESYVSCYYNRS
jgi:tetratricopeptide (TPR) repeat protein